MDHINMPGTTGTAEPCPTNREALPGSDTGTGLGERILPRHCTTAPGAAHQALAATLWHLTDELDRAIEELAFVSQGIALARLDTNNGAAFVLDRIRDQLQGLSQEALAAIKAQNGEGQP